MEDGSGRFPLFNRIVVLVVSAALAGGIVVSLVRSLQQGKPIDPVQGFLLTVFFCMSCGGIWLSLTWRNRTAREVQEEWQLGSPETPEIGADALAYHFPVGGESGGVFLEENAGAIHFCRCHVPRRFFDTAAVWYSCPVNEIQGVHTFRYQGESLTIITLQGKAVLTGAGADYKQLRQRLQELFPYPTPGYSRDHPLMNLVYVVGALAGFAGGLMIPWPGGDDTLLGLRMLIGAFTGVAMAASLVWCSDRWLKVDLVQPLAHGFIGLMVALVISQLATPFFGWNAGLLAGILLIGVVGGAGFGVYRTLRAAELRRADATK